MEKEMNIVKCKKNENNVKKKSYCQKDYIIKLDLVNCEDV